MQNQSSPVRSMCDPHSGQTHESSCQRCPEATQVTWGATLAAQTTIGSSALAITWVSLSRKVSRHSEAIIATSLARSSWSRLRLSRATAVGEVAASTWSR